MSPTTAKILVVDDDLGMLDTLADVLSATGYETSVAGSGHAALAKAQANLVVAERTLQRQRQLHAAGEPLRDLGDAEQAVRRYLGGSR